MIKKFSYAIYKLILLIDYFFKIATKRSFFIWFKHFIQNDSYKSITILDKEIKFFENIGANIGLLFQKEPETLEWIDTFKEKENLIFWDIGANIGLYSIYNTLKNKSSTTISFKS